MDAEQDFVIAIHGDVGWNVFFVYAAYDGFTLFYFTVQNKKQKRERGKEMMS